MFVAKNITKSFGGKKILHNINFCLHKGEIVALVGPNGSGKTTLIKCMSGLYTPNEGALLWDNYSIIDNKKDFLHNIGYVPELGGLYPEMTIYEYLHFVASAKSIPFEEAEKEIAKLAIDMNISSAINQKCETLSKGYKRRTSLAGALLGSPRLLLLDEPTEGLDPVQKNSLRTFLREYAHNSTILISTHIMEEVDAVADRILIINGGKLIRDTTPQELKKTTPSANIEDAFNILIGH